MNARRAGLAAGICLAALLTPLFRAGLAARFGQWLRALSLSGSAGNAAAWSIVLLLSALPAQQKFFTREGFATVGLIWMITGLVGALPFLFCGYFATPMDAIFESCSGFTTTGATILPEIEPLPKGILFWRACTFWSIRPC